MWDSVRMSLAGESGVSRRDWFGGCTFIDALGFIRFSRRILIIQKLWWMYLHWCTLADASTHAIWLKHFVWWMHVDWCSLVDSLWLIPFGACTLMDVLWLMHFDRSNLADARWLTHCGWCTLIDANRSMYFHWSTLVNFISLIHFSWCTLRKATGGGGVRRRRNPGCIQNENPHIEKWWDESNKSFVSWLVWPLPNVSTHVLKILIFYIIRWKWQNSKHMALYYLSRGHSCQLQYYSFIWLYPHTYNFPKQYK